MTARVKHSELAFACPIVGPKVYVTKGPSGWPETFKRAELDRELVLFLAPANVDQMVRHFIGTREIDENKEPTNWHTVMGYLGRMLGVAVETIPHTIGIAFWGRVVLASSMVGAN
jgi:hypothetical protein